MIKLKEKGGVCIVFIRPRIVSGKHHNGNNAGDLSACCQMRAAHHLRDESQRSPKLSQSNYPRRLPDLCIGSTISRSQIGRSMLIDSERPWFYIQTPDCILIVWHMTYCKAEPGIIYSLIAGVTMLALDGD
jgi:hypothetical protein